MIVVSEGSVLTSYFEMLLDFKKLPRSYSTVLKLLSKKAMLTHDGQKVYLNSGMKGEIVAELNCSLSYLNNCITDLFQADILQRLATGTYLLNKDLFGEYELMHQDKIKQIEFKIIFTHDKVMPSAKITLNQLAVINRYFKEPEQDEIEDEE